MLFSIILTIIFIKILCNKTHHVKLNDLGLCIFPNKLKWVLCATLLPLLVILFFMLMIPGHYEYSEMNNIELLNKIGFGILCIGISTGITEELWFRGYIMKLLEKNIGKFISIIITTIVFSLLHIININEKNNSFDVFLLIISGIMAGIMFASIVYKSNSIWPAVIVHIFWNSITGGIIHIGINENKTVLFNYILEKDLNIITGGNIGIEVSLPAMIGYIIVIIICNYKRKEYLEKFNIV
jgi:membrane protease YdiL (CAAX protease family)